MRISDWSSDVCSSDLQVSHEKFLKLRHHPLFLQYLEEKSPLKFLSEINISSRPVKRNGNSKLRRSEERRVGKGVSVRVDLGGRSIIKKKKQKKIKTQA